MRSANFLSKFQRSISLNFLEALYETLQSIMSISKITDKDIENFIREIKNLPAHYGKMKLSKKLTNKQAIEMGKKDNNIQKISVGTVDKYVSSLKTILQYATMKEYIPKNPFDKISLPKADKRKVNESKRLPFTLKQLQAIFEMRVFKSSRNYKFWIPMLALYTGARLNELCQLLVNDIKFDGDIAFFSINDDGDKKLKTSAAVRIVPIHSELVKMGFMDYVKEMREKKSVRLFPELKKEKKSGRYSNGFSKTFRNLLQTVNQQFSNENDKFVRGKHCFHSFRHNFRDCLRENECNQEAVRAIQGWGGDPTDLSNYYGKGFSVSKLSEILESKLVYQGLDLSCFYL